MTWVRIESTFFRHRKVLSLRLPTKLLFISGLCYSAEHGTDGYLSKDAVRVLSAELDIRPNVYARELEEANLWHKDAGGWHIHDFLVYQPSAAQERQRKQEHADRMKEWRERKARRDAERDMSHAPSHEPSRTLSPNPNPNPLLENSSSSRSYGGHPQEEEEPIRDMALLNEARRRLEANPTYVNNPDRWVMATARRLRAEGWTPAPPPPPPPRCATCKDVPLADPCPDCRLRSVNA